MRILRKVRADLGSGENIELYATVVVSVALAVLGALNVVNGQVLAAAILGTLALQAAGMLASRRQINDLSKAVRDRAVEDASIADFLAKTKPHLLEEVRGASEISIVGVTLSRTIRDLFDELSQRLADGATVKIALIDPRANVAAEAARRSTAPDQANLFENRLRPSVDLLRLLAVENPSGSFEARFLPFVPAFGLVVIDPQRPSGRIYVDIYSHRKASGDAVFCLRPHRDMSWYQHFQDEFARVWQAGRAAGEQDGFPAVPHRP
ncbi:hypothetical protein [Actinospica robiniae]|uniref:hypothetical protein n=1 Tax=Actinospica robiniae TaxID=304901 RepID=UPI0004169D65|nr:hypothetical protein [Actinospica robiniae]